MRCTLPCLVASVIAVAAHSGTAHAQETPSDSLLTVEHYLDWETVSGPQLSPDGSQVVYSRRVVNKMEDRWESSIWIMDADGSRNRFLVKGGNPRWSPDGSRILYLAQGEPRGTQIFVLWMDAPASPTQVTRVDQPVSTPTWAPDGHAIAFVMHVPDPLAWPISLPAAPQGAKWTRTPRIEDRLHYRQDRVGFTEPGHTHLFLVPADGGTPRQLTHGDWNVGARFDDLAQGAGVDFTPDGETLLFDGWMASDGDDIYQRSNVYALDVASGGIRDLTGERPGFWASPAVSPDGRTVAFVGADSTGDTHETTALWTMGVDGSGMRRVSGDLDRDPGDLRWAADGSGVYFDAPDHGSINVYFARAGGGVRQVTEGEQVLSLSSTGPDNIAVGIRSDPDAPGDVVRYDLRRGVSQQLTHANDDVLQGIHLGEVEEIRYPSTDGFRVQGWIVKPPSFDPSRKYPLILHIHGGPYAMYNVAFNYSFQNFAANGYVVLYVNPRGSTGYGTDFSDGIDHDYPSGDYDDLMAGVDSLIGRGY
ncbi:MAG: prolyl oligopeptidase family serine peptidase, partial [Gemmatimonadota bacterium]